MADDASTAQRVAQAWHLFAAGDLAGAIAQARVALSSHPSQPAGSAALGFFLIEAGELNDAAAVLLPACEQAPGHAPLHWYVGYLLQRRGDTMGAAAAFERACRLDASLDEAAFALAWALNDLGRVEEALGWALRALESARMPHRMLQSAWLFQATRQYERAVAVYREAIEAFAPAAPEQPRLHLHLSQCLRQLHQDKAADVVLRHALDTWPHAPDLSLESGWQLRARGDLHGALHQARALVGEHPHEARAWHLQGVLLQELGELEAADQAFAETHQRDPALTDALLRRAEIQRGWKQYAGARWLLGLVSERHPDHATAQNLLAQVLLDEGDTDGARRILVRRLRADARSPDLWRLLATVHSRRGHSRLALRLLCRARALSPGDVGTLRMLGWLALEQGDVPWAVQVVSDLVERLPADSAAQVQAAFVFAQAGQLPQAQAWAERAVAQAPDEAEAWRALSCVRLLQRRLSEAESAARQAQRLAPGQVDVLRQLGRVYAAANAHGQAQLAFLRAVEADPDNTAARLELAQAQGRAGHFDAALDTLAALAPRRPGWTQALGVRAHLLTEGGLDEAVDACARLLRSQRRSHDAVMIALRLMGLGQAQARRLLPLVPAELLRDSWRKAIVQAVHTQGHACLVRLVQAAHEDLDPDPWLDAAAPYVASLSANSDASLLARLARDAYRSLKIGSGSTRLPPARLVVPSEGRPRIAYVITQLHQSLLRRVLSAHADDRAEVYVYTSHALAGLPSHVRVQPLVPSTLAESCAANGIDVVIDTGGLHPFEGQCELLQAYARRVAPVQVGWLGCWGTAGGLFDVLLADEVSVPLGQEAPLHELVLRLEGGQWCWDPPTSAPAPAAPPVLARGAVTYGVTARSLKLDVACVDAFARVVAATPESTLRFIGEVANDWPLRRDILARMQVHGVAPGRVAFDPSMAASDYLRWFARIDLVLDSFPGNGGLSLLDPLWMGVPVVTLAGGWPGARQGASVLAALGLVSWVAGTVDEFCAKAVALAGDTKALTANRQSLRARLQASSLTDGRRVAAQIEDICVRLTREFADVATAPDAKSRVKARARLSLDVWLDRARAPVAVEMPAPAPDEDVELSVIVVLFNQAGLSRATLQALADQRGLRFETIIVDNASSDRTGELLQRVHGARVIRNDANVGFLRAARQGARAARGRYLAFLNSDAVLQEGALAATLRTLRADPSIGALGGRVVLTDGGLQEAGNRVFRDGSAGGIGRGESPFSHAALAGRTTDYVSGVFLVTPAALWRMLDGFDERLAPAYYEDTDYCLRVWRAGFRVWYEPSVLLEHLEWGSATGDSATVLMERNRALFRELHAPWLVRQPLPHALSLDGDRWAAPDDLPRRPRVLFVDNEVPHMFKGGGLPRARLMLQSLRDWPVTLFPLWEVHDHWHAVYQSLPRSIEVALGHGLSGLEAFLERRRGTYDVLLVSRPPNLQALTPLRARRPELFAGMRLVYDAEALFALREVAMAGVQGRPLPRAAARARIAAELALVDGASDVLVVSQRDARYFEAGGHRTHILSHGIAVRRAAPGPMGRTGLLFVGALHPDTPNEDGLLWFIREVMPRLRRRGGAAPVLSVVGVCLSERVSALAGDDVRILGPQDALEPHYDAARVFVAPVRFAGGVPAKVIEAAAAGVPTVASALLVRQLGWRDGLDVMGARDASTFAGAIARLLEDDEAWRRQQQAAWEQCTLQYDPQRFGDTLRRVLVGSTGAPS